MNHFAAAHNGIAPVVVIPDTLGSDLANPICADTVFGKVDTYLANDVPAAIRSQLRVDPDPKRWGFEGFSYGGTYAIQMATNHPDIYPNFVDISGQLEPTVGSRKHTVDAAFGGDAAKFTAINPMDLLATKKYPDSAGWFVWGGDDGDAKAEQLQVYAAAKAAGMDVQQWENPGTGHDWDTAAAGVAHTLPWLAGLMNLTA